MIWPSKVIYAYIIANMTAVIFAIIYAYSEMSRGKTGGEKEK